MHRVSFKFTKKGAMKFISHLDLMRLFMRAMRRADLPIKITEGFSPHPKFSIKRALKLGVESDSEEASIVLTEQISLQDFKDRLQKQLPEGIFIKQVLGELNSNIKNQISLPAGRQENDISKFKIFGFCIVILIFAFTLICLEKF